MNLFWDIYWPLLTVSAVLGAIAGAIGFRATQRPPRTGGLMPRTSLAVGTGALLVLALGGVWHGPLGAGEKLASTVDRQSRYVLNAWEMTQVQGRLERAPIKRSLVLSGPADQFQRSELIRIMNEVPGVANVRWMDMRPTSAMPLIVEVELAALLCFGLGQLLSYLLELRRRYRAQWRW